MQSKRTSRLISYESRDVAVGMSDVTEIAGPICNPQGINRNNSIQQIAL